jgi:hypothetical protein
MKKFIIYSLLLLVTLSFSQCEIDNYPEPEASIEGKIMDANGAMLQTEQGGGNMKLKLEELSWAGDDTTIAIIPSYLTVKQDGSFNNSKIFSGEYRITPIEGPFYPYNVEGELVTVSGHTTINFEVTPYLNIEWVTEPRLTVDNFIEAEVRFTRNQKEGLSAPDLNDARLYISTTKYCGNNNYDNQLVAAPLIVNNNQEGQTIRLITSRAVKYVGTTYYVRVGINCKDAYKKYNYTDIKTVVVGK